VEREERGGWEKANGRDNLAAALLGTAKKQAAIALMTTKTRRCTRGW